ncbi:reverse transcriptase domain-containing protein [Tanacetum coccineum]
MANTPVSENCSAIILKKLPEKLEDPGQFLIPCTFSELKCKALADLGASINLMPFSVYTKLGLPALQSTRMTLELANCSLCVPKGIARDVLVPVGRLTFPADFVVVDFECDYRVPLILGRPFLRTARTLIDVFGEEMSLRTDEERLILCKNRKSSNYTTRPHKSRLNFWKNKEVLEKNEILKRNNTCDFQTPSSSLEKKEVEGEKNLDVKTIVSFFAPIGNCVRKWATNEFVKDNDEINHEVFKSDNENDLGVHDNEEEEIAFLDGLLENENFFEMNDKKVESLERKTKEDFETKDEPKSKKELQVVHPDIEILNHFETTSYVGSDYVFYEDFNLVDMLFPMNIRGEIFDPGITFHEKPFEKDAFKDKSSKELAPSKSLLTLDVFDPLHPPLMDFHVTKAFSGISGFWKTQGSILWKNKAMPIISIDDLQSSLHKRDEVAEATIPSLTLHKTALAVEAQENSTKVQEKLDEEAIEKKVKGEGDEESYASEFADSMINYDVDDSSTKIEPRSHKEHPKTVTDDDEEIEKEKNE